MRGGRVNFKFVDTKSVFYFNDADLDVAPSSNGSVDLRFEGDPSRTDHAAQDFGRFYLRGSSSAGNRRLDFQVELEKSSLEETLRWIDPRGFGVHGTVALRARLSGAPGSVGITGQIQIDDVHRWDLLPRGGGWRLGYQGTLDLHNERVELHSTAESPEPPLTAYFRAWSLLTDPHWEAGAGLQRVPVATLLEIARHMGAALPETLMAEGTLSGAVTYHQPDGIGGRVDLTNASLTLPEGEPLNSPAVSVTMSASTLRLEPCTVRIGGNQSALLEGSYRLDASRALDLKITTRGLDVARMRSFGLAAIPLVERTPVGTWRGWARYRSGEWSGESELRDARIPVDGLADPVEVDFAAVSLSGARLAVNRMRARAGEVAFTGSYRWEPNAVRPHRFQLQIAEAEGVELARVLSPVLVRQRGFLARTLRLGSTAPVPEWLSARRADGTITVDSLKIGENTVTGLAARVLWDGTLVRFAGLNARLGVSTVAGDLEVDLARGVPRLHFDGRLRDAPYRGGTLDIEGTLEAQGLSPAEFAESLRAEGHLEGAAIAFSPDAEFRRVSGCFEVQGFGGESRWKLPALEVVTQAGETYLGGGASQPDGRLVLDLAGRGRQVRYAGALFASAGSSP
jgi:hypothetical protein